MKFKWPNFWKYGFNFWLYSYKYFEVEFCSHKEWNYFDLDISWTRKQDHAGLKLDFELLGLNLVIQVYDSRHWDYENDEWENSCKKCGKIIKVKKKMQTMCYDCAKKDKNEVWVV